MLNDIPEADPGLDPRDDASIGAEPVSAAGDSSADDASASEPALSLHACMDRLIGLGETAPSYITLKRWSRKGLLDAAKVKSAGRRDLYNPAVVQRLCADLLRPRGRQSREDEAALLLASQAAAAGSPTGAVSPAEIADLRADVSSLANAIAALSAQVGGQLASLAEQVALSTKAVESLEASRRSLMLRTDGELTALRGQVAALQGQLNGQANVGIEAAAGRLTRVAGQLENLVTRQS